MWLIGGCGDQPSKTPTIITTTLQPTDTPEPTKASPSPTPTPTSSRPDWLPVPPEKPTIIQLTDNPDWADGDPVFSPDGSQILFGSDRECYKRYEAGHYYVRIKCPFWDLFIINADGSNEVQLTDVISVKNLTVGSYAWSPDGERVAVEFFYSPDATHFRVFIFSVDQIDQAPLDLDDMDLLIDKGEDYLVGNFEWSPDGKYYAYYYSQLFQPTFDKVDIAIVDSESEEEIFRKTSIGGQYCSFDTWSPDGKSILFTCSPNMEDGHEYHIYWADVDTGNERLLIENAERPIWSPDGKWILYYSSEREERELFHVESGEVLSFPIPGFPASWSPDGKRIAFSNRDIYLVDMSWLEMEWD
jgi:Tol biopolymer transport system component